MSTVSAALALLVISLTSAPLARLLSLAGHLDLGNVWIAPYFFPPILLQWS